MGTDLKNLQRNGMASITRSVRPLWLIFHAPSTVSRPMKFCRVPSRILKLNPSVLTYGDTSASSFASFWSNAASALVSF